jgi:ABC-type transport system involved in multi-copper enzyme maturation permease subunit
MKKITKFSLIVGGFLTVFGVILFLFLARQYSNMGAVHPVLYLLSLRILFLCFFGPLIFLAGVFLWSFQKGLVSKITSGIFISIIIFILFVPIVNECPKPTGPWDDAIQCNGYFAYNTKYWSLVLGNFQKKETNMNVTWVQAYPKLLKESFGDLWGEIVKAGERI